jgi:uncharacterized membrane protein
MEETMTAARKPFLLSLAALALLTSLSGCIVAERPGRYHGDYDGDGPGWQRHWNNNWQGGGYQGGGYYQGGGNWNRY